jgi:enoyl-CoA hydratase/carnithine racemase
MLGELSSSPEDLVLSERRDAVQILTFNRPARLNAWTDELETQYFSLLDAAESDTSVRAVIVTGAGRGFCAGADLGDLEAVGKDGGSVVASRPRPRHRPLMFRKPLIAAINGAAAGLGLVEALYCDVRLATPEAKLTTAFSRRGLIAEYGIAWLLPRLVGQSRALDLLMSARVVRGDEAARLGLVDTVVSAEDLLATAVAYAEDLATNCSPTAMAVIKEQLLNAQQSSFIEAVEEADRRMYESFNHADLAEGVASYLEARPPMFAAL